ncbi:MAG TPA: BTAD domain-containing putative transcriptional regulator [Candidatus Deferrimicrobiaceae bacterium]|nr:BTAD domain-containing putative transcriptional regulator [Candidatus Deferrimicrobiaceae bacterium]
MEFRLLGPVSVVSAGRLIQIGGPMPRAALALLLIHAGRVVSTDQLVDLLWGDEPPRTAVPTVRAYLSRLRRALADTDPRPRLRSQASGYVIRVEPGELDVRTFEVAALAGRRQLARGDWAAAADELSQALEQWRGGALEGLDHVPALAAEARRLEEFRLLALTDRIEADLALGRHAVVLPELEGLVAAQPYRERAWAQLMLALYRSGRQAEALHTYQRARQSLVDDLGVEPGPELRRLELAVLRQDPSLDVPVAAVPVARPGGAASLPAERSSFVGRSRELAHIDRLLVENRMVTMTGLGGSGKTRIALRTARDAGERYPDGVWWVELASVMDPQLVAQQVAAAVGVSAAESKARNVATVLVDFLAERQALLVLDNCEHLVAAVADIAEAVLRACPGMRMLATSRESLGVTGEVTVPVPPLEVPPESSLSPGDYPSVRLFLDRAEAADPGFNPDAGDLQSIATICRRLEGIPLAVELSAARVTALTPGEIAARLAGHLDLVSGGPRTALPRHRSLRATLDWSFEMLDAAEQTLLCRASVFVGGFSLDALAAVDGSDAAAVAQPDATLDRVTRLVDRSLFQTYRRGRSLRYRLLEPVRQYALERLGQGDDEAAVRTRHAEHFLGLAREGDRHLRGQDQGSWLEELDADHGNLRAALDWALGAGEADLALRLIGSLGWYWLMRGHWAEARRWLDRALAMEGGSDLARAQATYGAGGIDIIRVKFGSMPKRVEEALTTCEREGDERGAAWCTHLLGHALMYDAAAQSEARALLHAGLERFRGIDDEWGVAWSLRYLGGMIDRDVEQAIDVQQDAIQRFRELGDLWSAAFALFALGVTLATHDRLADAKAAFEDGLELCRALDDRVMAAHNLRGLALTAFIDGDLAAAGEQFATAREAFHRAGDENCHAMCSMYLGLKHLQEGDLASARRELAVAMVGFRSIERGDGISQVLAWLAAVDLADGEIERAGVLIGASRWSEAFGISSGHRMFRKRLTSTEAAIRRRLGGAYRNVRAKGERMAREEAIRYALGGR